MESAVGKRRSGAWLSAGVEEPGAPRRVAGCRSRSKAS
jgi:hypothetical protein